MSTMLAESATAHVGRFLDALRPQVMGPELASALCANGMALGSRATVCHVLDAKYEPGVRAVVLYELGGRLVRGDLLPDPATDEPGVVAPGLRVSAFPHDQDLPSLPRLMDATVVGPLLGGSSRPQLELLRYRPGKRATVRVRFDREHFLVAKAYHRPDKAAAVAEEAASLFDAAAGAATLRLAPVHSHLADLGWVVQRPVDGRPLDALVGNPRVCPADAEVGIRLAARALAELHTSSPTLRRERSVDKELRRFGVRSAGIATVDPALGQLGAELAQRLVDVQEHLPPAHVGPVHGDCKPSQFLLAPPRAVLLDLDHCGLSDQAADVGTFMATLRQLAVRHHLAGRPEQLGRRLGTLAEDFLAAYLHAIGDDSDGRRQRVRWHEAVALERKALRSFARAPRSPVPAALIHEANRCLDRLTETA